MLEKLVYHLTRLGVSIEAMRSVAGDHPVANTIVDLAEEDYFHLANEVDNLTPDRAASEAGRKVEGDGRPDRAAEAIRDHEADGRPDARLRTDIRGILRDHAHAGIGTLDALAAIKVALDRADSVPAPAGEAGHNPEGDGRPDGQPAVKITADKLQNDFLLGEVETVQEAVEMAVNEYGSQAIADYCGVRTQEIGRVLEGRNVIKVSNAITKLLPKQPKGV